MNRTTFPFAILPLLLALGAAAPAQTPPEATEPGNNIENHNPDPAICCDCIRFHVAGISDAPDRDPGRLWPSTTGEYNATVTVTYEDLAPPGQVCPEVLDVKVIARLLPDRVHEEEFGGKVGKNLPPLVLPFILPADLARMGDTWEFTLSCGMAPAPQVDPPADPVPATQDEKYGCSTIAIPLGSCSSCGSAEGCDSVSLAPAAENGSFTVTIPTSRAHGGLTEGALVFRADDLGAFPGRAGLLTNLPRDFTVTRAGGLITMVDTGAGLIHVADTPGEQNSITLTHEFPENSVLRTTVISLVDDNGTPKLRMDSALTGDPVTRHEQSRPGPGTFVMLKGRVVGGTFETLRWETLVKTEPVPGTRVHRRTVDERPTPAAGWETVSDVETTWENQLRGWVMTRKVVDPAGAALVSTWSYYQPGEITGPGGSTEGLGRLKHYAGHDGSESFHTYSLHQSTVLTPFAGQPDGKLTTSTWNPVAKTRTTIVTVGGHTLSHTVATHGATTRAVAVHTGQGAVLETTTHYVPSGQPFGGKPLRTLHPDGTLTTHEYAFTQDGGVETVTANGATTDDLAVSQGTRTTIVTNSRGTTILRETTAIGHGTEDAVFESMAVTLVDSLGRPLETAWFPESAAAAGEQATALNPKWTTTTEYSCCGVSSETDMHGIRTYHAYDGLQRRIKTNRLGVTTETVRNGLSVETHRYAETVAVNLSSALVNNAANLVAKSVRNLAGTLAESWSPDPTSATPGALVKSSSTATTFQPDEGISRRTVTTVPGGHTQTTDTYLDGRTAATSGDLAPAMEHEYTVNATGERTSQSFLNTENLKLETTFTQSDWAGRALQTAKGTIVTDYEYHGAVGTGDQPVPAGSGGKLRSVIDADGVATLFAYNARGERTTTALKLDAAATITYGTDQITFSETVPALDGNDNPVWRTSAKVWHTNDADPPQVVETTVSTSIRTPDGLFSSTQTVGVANPSESLTILGGNGNWITTTTNPDGTYTQTTYVAGLMDISEAFDSGDNLISSNSIRDNSNVPLSGYDALKRPVHQRDSRTGTTTTAYLSATADFVASVTDPGTRETTFTYDSRGRRTHVDAPDTFDPAGAPNNTDFANITETIYNPDGTVQEVTGAQTYRVTHTYDYARRMETMTTYGTETATTTWIYNQATGLLVRKEYEGGKGTDYDHTPAGRLKTRTWARGNHTRYDYAAGRLHARRYFLEDGDDTGANPGNDPLTRDVVFQYDALGRPETVSEGGNRNWTYTYDADLRLETESHPLGGSATQRLLTRRYDELSRPAGLDLGTSLAPAADFSVDYDYDTSGRLEEITSAAGTFTYGYQANSYGLIHTITGQNGANPVRTVTNTWEAHRDVLDMKENKVAAATVSSFDYTVNDLGQRTGVTTDGSAFGDADRGWSWGYDSLGQVTTAAKTDDAVHDRAYTFDAIGNRLTAIDDPADTAVTTTYTPNALNQYEEIDNGDILEPVHDDDGNLLQDMGVNLRGIAMKYVWDGENRLIEARLANDSLLARYEYDYLSRRILTETTAAAPQGVTAIAYLYDGWNVVAEYEASTPSTPVRLTTHTWGLDLSGSMQGAGGVGGLLAVTRHGTPTEHFYPTYDGNGNVSEYLDEDGEEVAHYQYDPFGRLVAPTGDWEDFQYRFSTKPQADETGLLYYGYRYFDPHTGRWPSRDPIEELGGVNLHAFISNKAINDIDILGLAMGPEGRGNHMGGPEWTCESAREHLNEVVKKWKDQYPAAAKILGKFLEGNGDDHDFSNDAAFVNEIKEKGKSIICGRISAEVCKDPKRGETNVNLDSVNIRWNPSLPDQNAMFYAYGGARLSVNGTATVGRALFWNGTFDVTLGDRYVFLGNLDGKGKGFISNTFGKAYRAGRHLQENCKGQNPAAPFSHTTSFSIDCNGCCARAPMPYEGPGF